MFRLDCLIELATSAAARSGNLVTFYLSQVGLTWAHLYLIGFRYRIQKAVNGFIVLWKDQILSIKAVTTASRTVHGLPRADDFLYHVLYQTIPVDIVLAVLTAQLEYFNNKVWSGLLRKFSGLVAMLLATWDNFAVDLLQPRNLATWKCFVPL